MKKLTTEQINKLCQWVSITLFVLFLWGIDVFPIHRIFSWAFDLLTK